MARDISFTPTMKEPCHKIMPSFAQAGRQCESAVKAQIGNDGLLYGYICIKFPEVHKIMNAKGRKV